MIVTWPVHYGGFNCVSVGLVIVECSSTVTLSVRVTSLGLRSAIPMGEGTRYVLAVLY